MTAAVLKSKAESEIDQALSTARRQWLSLGVWYAMNEAQEPTEPERLLLSTAWLFAYDFHFQTLVAAWVKFRGEELDLPRLATLVRASGTSDLATNARRRQLALAYLFALARMMVWEERGGWRRRKEWLAIARSAHVSLGGLPLAANELIEKDRLEEIKRLTRILRFRRDPHLHRLGLDLPRLGIEEERKILPQSYVRHQVARTRWVAAPSTAP